MAVVGVGRWVLHLPGCRSLKEKRSVIRGLKDRMISRFKVSAAETDHQDRPSMAEITAAVASPDRHFAERVVTRLDAYVRSDPRAQVVESEIEYL